MKSRTTFAACLIAVLTLSIGAGDACAQSLTQGDADAAGSEASLMQQDAVDAYWAYYNTKAYHTADFLNLEATISNDPLVPQNDKNALIHDCRWGGSQYNRWLMHNDTQFWSLGKGDAKLASGDAAYQNQNWQLACWDYHAATGRYGAVLDAAEGMRYFNYMMDNDMLYDDIYDMYQMSRLA